VRKVSIACIALLLVGCATQSGGRRRGRSGRGAPILLQGVKRLSAAAIDFTKGAATDRNIGKLRNRLCEGREDRRLIFYQLVVSKHWHYYWLCSKKGALRAATRSGARQFGLWLRAIKNRARNASAECDPGSIKRLVRSRHKSGVLAKAYCDGVLILRYPDASKITTSFSRGALSSSPPARRPAPNPQNNYTNSTTNRQPTGRCPPCDRICPQCPACPQSKGCPAPPPCPRCPRCKQCPTCPKPNPKTMCKAFGAKAFWQGVSKACKRICTAIYKKCRSINSKTAMCYQLSEYCAGLKGVCNR
jgi:hypothetical protein